MITNLIRKALGPEIENRLNGESIRLNAIINEMENAIADMNSISAPDIADYINTYDIAQDISIDAYEIAKNIEIDATDIEIDYAALARHLGDNIDIDASDIEIDIDALAKSIASHQTMFIDSSDIDIDYSALGRHIGGNIDIDYSDLARDIVDHIDFNEVNARINNVHPNLQTVERKMDLILKHLGITPENA